ncbi:class I tRNA ligase family protein [Longispora albida]|uniref:class I tRNA ligase family protein n=1 Tax=Longispora albida TaxID=203523 RepID=UPI00037306C6|nr:class I tRNA ligase family protein [Longispora albida]
MSETPGYTVITIPPPTPNGPLHMGHMSGPFIGADYASRALRARGRKVITMAGVDVSQNWVLTRAEKDGVDVDEMTARYMDEIEQAYQKARIGYDAFVDTRDDVFHQAMAHVVGAMTDRGGLKLKEITLLRCSDCARTLHSSYVSGTCSWCGNGSAGGSCEGCGGHTSAENLTDPVCARCGGAPEEFTVACPVLVMEDYREQLQQFWSSARVTDRVRALAKRYLDNGLPEVPIAYPTNWGIHCEADGDLAGLRVDVWAELALSYVPGVAWAIDPQARTLDEFQKAFEQVDEVWHFHGLDNAFYSGVLWPALYFAAGFDPMPLKGVNLNEFYTLDGLKFSTSRNHAIWAHELLATEDPALVRLYLAWDRPDRYSSDFTREAYEAFRDYVRPMVYGEATATPSLPPVLAAAELRRGLAALELPRFDPPLAARSLLSLLAAGADAGPLFEALTGQEQSQAPGQEG